MINSSRLIPAASIVAALCVLAAHAPAHGVLLDVKQVRTGGDSIATTNGAHIATLDAADVTGSLAITGFALHNSTTELDIFSATPNPVVWTFTLSGVDLDGGGGGNDSMTWQLTMTPTPSAAYSGDTSRVARDGSDIVVVSGINDSTRETAANEWNRINGGETLTLSLGAISVLLNGSTPDTASFIGFDAFNVVNGTATVNGGTYAAGPHTITPAASLVFSTPDVNAYRLRNVGFQIEYTAAAVPAPAALPAGIAVLTIAAARRRQ